MILINYDLSPDYSLAYTSAKLFSFLYGKRVQFEDAKNFFLMDVINKSSLFYYSLDFLYLIGKVKEIKDGVIICE